MAFNGYRNYETWAFMLYFEDYIYETLREQQEYENQEINYEAVYNMVEAIIDEISESIDRIEYGYAFVKDLLNASLGEIDIHEVAETLMENLKED